MKFKKKASYVTRVTCKLLDKSTAFLREGETEDADIFHRAEMFAFLWREVKDMRRKINNGSLCRNEAAKPLKYRKKAMLALVQGAEEFEVEKILAGENLFRGVVFTPQAKVA